MAELYGSALVKGKAILDFFLTVDDDPTLAEIARGSKLSKSTALKLLTTLTALNLVWRDDETKRYRLGTLLIEYGEKATASFDITTLALPFLTKLRDETGETINLGIAQNDEVVVLKKLESPNSVKLQSVIGGTMNMYSSAMGKAMLAEYPAARLENYLKAKHLQPVTPHTIVDPDLLIAELAGIRRRGFAIDNEENEPEVYCLGATLAKNGHPYGAFSISAPKYRMPHARREDFAQKLLAVKGQIQAAL